MATLQPSERAIRDLQSGTLSAEVFDQTYGLGASQDYLQLSQPITEETEEVKEEQRGLIADTAIGVAEGVRTGINAFGEATQELGDTLREKGVNIPVYDIRNNKFLFDQEEIDKMNQNTSDALQEALDDIENV